MLFDILESVLGEDVLKKRVVPVFYGYATFNIVILILLIYISVRISIR